MSEPVVPKMLKALPQDRLDDLRKGLLEGRRPVTMARTIQENWGLLQSAKRDSLVKTIRRYKEKHCHELAVLEHAGATKTVLKAEQKLANYLNVFEGYQELLQIQMARVRVGYSSEQEDNRRYKQTSADIDVMNRLLANYGNLALRGGILQRMIPTDEAMRGVVTNALSESVLGQSQLKEGLMHLIGSVMEDVQADEDDFPLT